MSAKEKLAPILKEASEGLKDENNVAIIGPSGSGKTVFLALLNHALDNYFFDEHPELKGHANEGLPFLELCENAMKEGTFPDRTQQLSRDQIVIEMRSTGATATGFEFRLPDISGEDYANMCLGEEIRGEERVLKVFEMGKAKNATYGHMGYAVYAKMYVILLDCSKIDEWDKMQSRYSQALISIQDFKVVTNTSKNGRIDVPIAVVLTKADNLEDRDVNPEELVKQHMRRFYNAFNDIHDGKKAYFMEHVEIQRNRENEVENSEGLKVAIPLSYNHTAFTKFLWWLHENLLE